METSSRNSEVIHSGLYYPKDSLKTKLAIHGRELLYDFCTKYNIQHQKVTKWIVSPNANTLSKLMKLYNQTKLLEIPAFLQSKSKSMELEPRIKTEDTLVCTETGIIDSHGYMNILQNQFNDNDGISLYNTKVTNVERLHSRFLVSLKDANQEYAIETDNLINCAGLYADKIANMLLPKEQHYKLYFAKGHYYGLRNSVGLVNRLIYPIPDANLTSLGIHLTLDLSGRIKFGPDVVFQSSNSNYTFDSDPNHLDTFHQSISTYMDVDKRDLFPDYTGIRPKLNEDGSFRDFIIESPYKGFVNLIGIESPGLTSSLAIAEYVKKML
ncbi:FAD dependent oxidoreductase [Globomyces pollinis-pini]|nr:FAD dependent oxidoreductase [Globomyces pollinis-pini]